MIKGEDGRRWINFVGQSRRLKQSEFLKGTSYASSRRFERNKRNGKEMAKEFAKSEERVRLSVIAVGDTASGGGA